MMVPDTQPFDGHLDHEDNLFDRLFQVRDKADVDMHLVCPYFFERLRLVKEVYPTQLLSTGSSPTEQLRLSGIDDDQIQEASYAALQSAGFSAYLHGIGYSLSRWLEALSGAVEHIKSQSG